MFVDCNINSVIEFLQKKKEEGYKTVELIDDSRECGWFILNPQIPFIGNASEPTVLGIDIRNNK